MSRPFSLVRHKAQWERCAHEHTTLDPLTSVVSLAEPRPSTQPFAGATGVVAPVGFAVDAACRVFRTIPEEHRVERWLWANPREPARDVLTDATWRPAAIAFDASQRLFVAADAPEVLVYEHHDGALRRRIALGGDATVRVVDLTSVGDDVWGLATGGGAPRLVRLTADGEPAWEALPPEVVEPSRLTASASGALLVLGRRGTANARVTRLEHRDGSWSAASKDIAFASDVEFLGVEQDVELFVVAGPPEQVGGVFQQRAFFERLAWDGARLEQVPGALRAPAFDGRGIFRTPPDADGVSAIGFFGAGALRVAARGRVTYQREGRVAVFALDAGEFQTRWGRLFLDACIPPETQVKVRCLALDEVPDDVAEWPWTAPVDSSLSERPIDPGRLPPQALLEARPAQWLFERPNGHEQAWDAHTRPAEFTTWEAPVTCEPGRYLWLLLELSGNGRATPSIRAVRAEHPGHDLLRRLPRVFSRDAAAASFLQRYLAPAEGLLTQLETRAALRHVLVSPDAAPPELLEWLGSFLGLVMDRRWPVPVRREFLRETARLFRRRGTVWSLRRMLEIVLGVAPVIVEKFRLRGLGGVQLGGLSTAVLGAGLRVGGALAEPESELPNDGADAFETHAHRFSVFVPAWLDASKLEQARFILDHHRPAHTEYELCTLAAGMRVGIGLHVGLTAFVGETPRLPELQLRETRLGGALLGPGPEDGARTT
ncbi:MAG: phage tail protein [Myxococcota bacterium]